MRKTVINCDRCMIEITDEDSVVQIDFKALKYPPSHAHSRVLSTDYDRYKAEWCETCAELLINFNVECSL